MKARYTTHGGKLNIELPESEGVKGLFNAIAEIDEIFDAIKQCGACHKDRIQLRVREVDKNKYYEAQCVDCRARLEFGQTKVGEKLFPKRKSKDGEWLPNKGWTVWQPSGGGTRQLSDADESPF